MRKDFTWKFILVVGIIVGCGYAMWPPFSRDPIALFDKTAIGRDDAYRQLLQKVTAKQQESPNQPSLNLREAVDESKLELRNYFPSLAPKDGTPQEVNHAILRQLDQQSAGRIRLGLDLKGGFSFLVKADLSKINVENRGSAMAQAIDIIRKRIDRYGVAEPIIQPVGGDRILVQIPGLQQSFRDEVRKTIEGAAFLEFCLVHEHNAELLDRERTEPGFRPPVGYKKMFETETRDGRPVTYTYYVKLTPELTGKHVSRASAQSDQIGRPHVALEFDAQGTEIFGRVTTQHVGHQLAIILDGQLYSAPVINEAIMGGRAEISGHFTMVEATQLANVLENPMEAPVKIVEERSVDPSLGRDSITSGLRAGLFGAVAVVLFMVIYYRAAGLIANFALALNILILIGVLAMFGFTLTLPGIAGIVLTVGMAVDANVLIYERIREEMTVGKPLRAAIAAGYTRAFLVIFDSNFTTIITAVILIWLGSGPVKGFGVTLTIGLVANLFAAVFVTRLMFDWLADKGWLKSINMLHIFKKVHRINFLGIWKMAFGISWVLIIAGMIVFVKRGGLDVGRGEVYGIDFKGGDTVTLSFHQKLDTELVVRVLEQHQIAEGFPQYQREASGAEVLDIRLPEGAADKAVAALTTDPSTAGAGFKVLGTERVGAVIGAELLKQALVAVVVSLIAIMLYVAFRFGEFSYGLGALISLIHDVLMTIGWFCLTGRTFSMTVVAAILTLIGYSINDTIVVFDRIREDKKLTGGRLNYFELINRSVNETLSRTILTAGTVFLCAASLYLFGGRVLNDFAFCFLIGVLTGTYSSIYIASPCVLWYHRKESRPASTKPAPARV